LSFAKRPTIGGCSSGIEQIKTEKTNPCCACAAHVLLLIEDQNLKGDLKMNAQAQHETMLRKPILMPPSMIKKVDRIAKQKKVSFAEVVREAVEAFGEKPTSEDERILDVLADTMIETTEYLIKRMDEIEKSLDSTHALLEAV
jgi:hypothetical protein